MTDFFKTVRSFILEYLQKQRSCSENTVASYRATLNLLVEFLRTEKNLTVSQIQFSIFNREVIIEFLNWLEHTRRCSASTRNQRLAALRSFFEYAGVLDCAQVALQMDVEDIPFKKEEGRIVEFLTEDALKTLLRQPDITKSNGIRDRFFMMLMYDTAARCGELLGARVRNLRLNTKYPEIYLEGKGGKPRNVALLNKTVEHCKRYLQIFHANSSPDDYLFYTNIHGVRNKMSHDAVAAFMKKYGERAKRECPEIPNRVHPHQLRHTRAIHFYRDGMPLVLVAEQLGHASVETTKVYAYADSKMKRTAMEKADARRNMSPQAIPMWANNEEMILQLSGLR